MSKRYVVAMLLIALSAFSLAAYAQDAAAEGPRLSITEPVKNVGTIGKGDMINVSFEIKNTGTTDLQITAVKPSCGCTVAEFDKVIKPGATGKVTAHVETNSSGPGPISKLVMIETNDPNAPSAQLTIQGMIKTFVESFPAGYTRFLLLQGEELTQSITLYSEEEEPFQIVKVEVPADYKDFISVKYAKIEKTEDLVPAGRKGQNQYRFDVTAGKNAKPGPLFGKIIISTNSKRAPQYPVSLTGMIRPSYQVEPSAVNFGEVKLSDAAASSRTIALRSNRKDGVLKVLKVDSSTKLVTTEIKAGAQPGTTEIVVKVAPDAKGPIEGVLKIQTDDPSKPVTEIPLRGLVKPAEN